jgi:hypothetical protein
MTKISEVELLTNNFDTLLISDLYYNIKLTRTYKQMAGGGFNIKKLIVSAFVDHPGKVYLGGAAFLYFYRQYAISSTYRQHFGKFDFQRRLERNELKY